MEPQENNSVSPEGLTIEHLIFQKVTSIKEQVNWVAMYEHSIYFKKNHEKSRVTRLQFLKKILIINLKGLSDIVI